MFIPDLIMAIEVKLMLFELIVTNINIMLTITDKSPACKRGFNFNIEFRNKEMGSHKIKAISPGR